jgi:hypothetical protein
MTTKYYFEVDYMPLEEVKELLEDLLSSYRAYHTDSHYREIKNPAEQAAVREKGERSASALHSLFSSDPGYSPESLSLEGPNAFASALEDLVQIANNIQQKRPGGIFTSTWADSAKSADDLSSKLQVFIQDKSLNGSPVLWPFIGIIRVYLKSYFLRTGIILADLPGESILYRHIYLIEILEQF